MNLNISLSPEIEANLLEQAALTGLSPEVLAVKAVQEKFASQRSESLSLEKWHTKFDEF